MPDKFPLWGISFSKHSKPNFYEQKGDTMLKKTNYFGAIILSAMLIISGFAQNTNTNTNSNTNSNINSNSNSNSNKRNKKRDTNSNSNSNSNSNMNSNSNSNSNMNSNSNTNTNTNTNTSTPPEMSSLTDFFGEMIMSVWNAIT